MTKKDKIKYLVIEYMKSYEVGSSERKEIYIKQDSIINKIDRNWTKDMINSKYLKCKCNDEKIGSIMNTLLR